MSRNDFPKSYNTEPSHQEDWPTEESLTNDYRELLEIVSEEEHLKDFTEAGRYEQMAWSVDALSKYLYNKQISPISEDINEMD